MANETQANYMGISRQALEDIQNRQDNREVQQIVIDNAQNQRRANEAILMQHVAQQQNRRAPLEVAAANNNQQPLQQ